jgi:phosphate transport system substrate-binding protein
MSTHRVHPSRRDCLALAGASLLPWPAFAAYPLYSPQSAVAGSIRIWGHGSRDRSPAGALVAAWARGFQRIHPAVRFEVTLRGDSTAIGGLYTGAADVALMERPPIAIELDGYKPIFGHDPFGVVIATGSLDRADHALAPVVFVHRRNPLTHLSLAQLDAVIGADRRRGHPPVATWGDLGVAGPLRDQPVEVLTYDIASELPQFLETAVMGGSQKWTGRLREFGASPRALMQALQDTPNALAIATWPDRTPQAKAIALAASPADPAVLPTRDTVAQRRYPLVRDLQVFVERTPGQPLRPVLHEFLSYLLSAPGQQAITRDGGYFALPAQDAQRGKESLA